jgi:hypothetical protein
MKRYAGKRISYRSLYGCGVPETADAAKQLQDELRGIATPAPPKTHQGRAR